MRVDNCILWLVAILALDTHASPVAKEKEKNWKVDLGKASKVIDELDEKMSLPKKVGLNISFLETPYFGKWQSPWSYYFDQTMGCYILPHSAIWYNIDSRFFGVKDIIFYPYPTCDFDWNIVPNFTIPAKRETNWWTRLDTFQPFRSIMLMSRDDERQRCMDEDPTNELPNPAPKQCPWGPA